MTVTMSMTSVSNITSGSSDDDRSSCQDDHIDGYKSSKDSSMDSTDDDDQDFHDVVHTKRSCRRRRSSSSFGGGGPHDDNENGVVESKKTLSSFLSMSLAHRGFPDRINPQSLDMLYLWDDDDEFGGNSGGCRGHYSGGGYNRPIPHGIVEAIKTGEKCRVRTWLAAMTDTQAAEIEAAAAAETYGGRTLSLASFRTFDSNETPFHLICSAIGSAVATSVLSSYHRNNDCHRAGISRLILSMMDILDDFLIFDASSKIRTDNNNTTTNIPVRCTSLFVQDNHGSTPLHSLMLGMKKMFNVSSLTSCRTTHLPYDDQWNDLSSELVKPLRRILFPLQEQHHRCRPSAASPWAPCCMLLLLTDQDGKTPFEYLPIPANRTAVTHSMIDFFQKESVIAKIVSEWTTTRSGFGPTVTNVTSRQVTAMERFDTFLNLSGLSEAIMEMGFEV